MTRHKAGEDPDASFESEGTNELTRSDSQMDTSTGTTEKENKTNEQTVPDLPPQDNFAPRSADVPAQGSSLRIGRTKTSRQHLARPTIQRPLKKKFSAAFEDDDVDDDMEERNQEIEKLNEIQAKAPPFKIDSNFFAKPPQVSTFIHVVMLSFLTLDSAGCAYFVGCIQGQGAAGHVPSVLAGFTGTTRPEGARAVQGTCSGCRETCTCTLFFRCTAED